MKTFFFSLLLVVLCLFLAFPKGNGQGMITGQLKDSASQQPLSDAYVVLLHVKDSAVAGSTFTDAKGIFRFIGLREGEYLVILTFLGYQQITRSVAVNASHLQTDLGGIDIWRTGLTLAAVEVVEQRSPMVVKKDTVEFDAEGRTP